MYVEVIINIKSTPTSYSADITSVTFGEAVMPDRTPEYGDEDYGKPQLRYPYRRADNVLDYVAATAKTRVRALLREHRTDAEAVLKPKVAKWESEQAMKVTA